MEFAPPKDQSYGFQDYPRWLLWLRNVLANGELQLRVWMWSAGGTGGGMWLVRQGSWTSGVFSMVVGSRRPGAISQSGVPVIGHSQLVWESWRQGAVSQCEGPRDRLRDPGGGAQSVLPGVLQGLAVVSKWRQPCVTKSAGTVAENFQATTGS